MRIAINGTGIAGPTLAWWLRRFGHEPVLFEQASALRTSGYVIDFWGVGYDIAEKMGLLTKLHDHGYDIQELRLVNQKGRKTAGTNAATFSALTNGRFLSIPRGDIASIIYEACEGVETRFGISVTGIESSRQMVTASLSDGSQESFDIVVGADGLHSHIREIAFGPMSNFERRLGCHVAAFQMSGYTPRDELAYVTHTLPGRQVARISLRNNMTMFLFIFSDHLAESASANGQDNKSVLRNVFDDMKWEVPSILEKMNDVENIYYDRVSQIQMDHWTKGRIALVGDAAACASLLAGEGTGLAMTEAYVLAGELHRSGGDHEVAFHNYESRLHSFLAEKQKSARRMTGFFVPQSRLGLILRDLGTNLASIPWIAKMMIGRMLRDNLELPDYD